MPDPILRKSAEQRKLRLIKPPSSKWDLYGDGPNCGLSYSHMSKFYVCRERTRLRLVEGLVSVDRREAMEFGTIFHKAMEFNSQGKTTTQTITALRAWSKKSNVDFMLCRIAATMIPFFKDFWKEVFSGFKCIEQEKVFAFPYKVFGKTITLRGRRDATLLQDGALWLLEHKTKSEINEDLILATLPYDLQTMLYMTSLKHDFKNPLGGVVYNIIRKPGLEQHKKESEIAFLTRISKDIDKRPEHYFKMFTADIDDAHLVKWRREYLDPLLSQIIIWWESIKHNPFDPWVGEDGRPNPHHFARPFGVYDPMSRSRGDYFERVVGGTDFGLVEASGPFPELEAEQGNQYTKKPRS